MATLFIAELAKIGLLSGRLGDEVQAPLMPPIAEQVLAVGVASVQSEPFNDRTKFVRLLADVDCSVAFGSDPAADAAINFPLVANVEKELAVNSGDKVAVITRA